MLQESSDTFDVSAVTDWLMLSIFKDRYMSQERQNYLLVDRINNSWGDTNRLSDFETIDWQHHYDRKAFLSSIMTGWLTGPFFKTHLAKCRLMWKSLFLYQKYSSALSCKHFMIIHALLKWLFYLHNECHMSSDTICYQILSIFHKYNNWKWILWKHGLHMASQFTITLCLWIKRWLLQITWRHLVHKYSWNQQNIFSQVALLWPRQLSFFLPL